MANRAFFSDNDGMFLEKRRTVYAVIDFGNTGAPTLKKWTPTSNGVAGSYATAPTGGTQGVASIAREAQGKYLLALQDGYQRLVSLKATWQRAASTGTPVAPAAPLVTLVSDKTNVTTTGSNPKSIELATFAATSSSVTTLAPTDPANGERLFLEIVLDDSGVAGG